MFLTRVFPTKKWVFDFQGFQDFKKYLKASALPPAPLAVAGSMVVGLVAWQYSDQLVGFLTCWVLLLAVRFARTLCWSVCWLVGFWMLVSMPLFGLCSCLATTIANCALLYDFRFWSVRWLTGLVGFRCLVLVLVNSSAETCAGAPGCRTLSIFANRS